MRFPTAQSAYPQCRRGAGPLQLGLALLQCHPSVVGGALTALQTPVLAYQTDTYNIPAAPASFPTGAVAPAVQGTYWCGASVPLSGAIDDTLAVEVAQLTANETVCEDLLDSDLTAATRR